MRVLLGPYSVSAKDDQAVIDLFETKAKELGLSKSELFRRMCHHWIKTGNQGLEPDHVTRAYFDSQMSIVLEALTQAKVPFAVVELDRQAPEVDPKVLKAQEALDRLANL